MMSRITINLKKSVHKVNDPSYIRPVLPSMFTQKDGMDVDTGLRVVVPGFNDSRGQRSTTGDIPMTKIHMTTVVEVEDDARWHSQKGAGRSSGTLSSS